MSPVSAALVAGRYCLDRRVAVDRLGEVWHGTDIELARPVAVKLLHIEAGDANAVSEFRAAARRAASLAHEGLVRVFDYCEPEPPESAQRPFLVMEYVDGQSLADLLHAGPLGVVQTVDIVAQVSAALQAMHQTGLVHGDIRPEKILLSHGGSAKLFGFSSTTAAGPAAIGADLRALGILARGCLGERTSPPDGALSGQIPESVAALIGELCAHPSSDQPDVTAAIARRAATLRARLNQSAAAGRGNAPSASPSVSSRIADYASPESTQPLPRLPGRARRPAVTICATAVLGIALGAAVIFGAIALKPDGGTPKAAGAAKVTSVRVAAAQLIGKPVDVARLRLERLGLIVRIRWRSSDRVSAGDVIAVRPAGLVPAHSVVVIVGSSGRSGTDITPYAGQAQAPHPHPRRSASRAPASKSARPTPSPSPSSSSTPAPTPSPSSSPAPSSSTTSSPSPSTSSSPPSRPPELLRAELLRATSG